MLYLAEIGKDFFSILRVKNNENFFLLKVDHLTTKYGQMEDRLDKIKVFLHKSHI